jgi:PAS domain S-box-containing protein
MAIMAAKTATPHPGLEALQDAFYMVDAEWRITYWNAAAARCFALTADQVLGKPLWDVLPSLAEQPFADQMTAAMATRSATGLLMPHPPGCCDGFYCVRISPLDDGGLAAQVREATEEIRLSERYERLLESIRDGFVAVDADGRVLYMNQVAERLLRMRRADAVGSEVWPLIPARLTHVQDALRESLRDAQPRRLKRLRPQLAAGRARWFDIWFFPLPGGGVSLFFQDVSKHVRREHDLARFAAEAEDANRAKARFFAAVSHELRTPLNALVGYTYLLSTETYGTLPNGADRAAHRANVCAEHLSRLVDDVLLITTSDVARLPVTRRPVPLAEFLGRAVEPIRQQAESKRLRFVVDLPCRNAVVSTDPDRLRQLLHALLSNAVKFTPQGEVRLEIRAADEAQGEEVEWRGSAPGVLFRISDTGPGIPAAERERVFGAFEKLGDPSRTDTMIHGPGLGLTLARRLAILLGGSLWIVDSHCPGTMVALHLPHELNA